MRRFGSAATAALLACACADGEASARQTRYACDDGTSLTVRFNADASEATVERPRQDPLVLPRRISGSGFLYETPQYTLRGKGNEATWTVGRRVPAQCRVSS